MATQRMDHHGFSSFLELKDRIKIEAENHDFAGWLLVFSVAGLTVFFVISFFIL